MAVAVSVCPLPDCFPTSSVAFTAPNRVMLRILSSFVRGKALPFSEFDTVFWSQGPADGSISRNSTRSLTRSTSPYERPQKLAERNRIESEIRAVTMAVEYFHAALLAEQNLSRKRSRPLTPIFSLYTPSRSRPESPTTRRGNPLEA